MPGLLDFFTGGGSEAQNQGLLAAAAQMLQASGPSLRPTSFGQVLGAGYGGYQQAQQQAQEQAYNALKMRGLQGELSDKDKARKDALAAQDWLRKYNQPDATAQARSVLGNNLSPTVENASLLSAAKPAQATPDQYTQRLAQAQAMRASGIPSLVAQADALEEHALKFKPKFETKPQVVRGPDGNPMLIQTADDGTVRGLPGGYGVAEKLDFRDGGGSILGLDPYTGKQSLSIRKTQSPDSIAAGQRVDSKGSADSGQVENVAGLIASGRMAPLGQMAMRSPFGAAVMSRVAELNPTFRAQDFGTSSKAERDFATGKQGNSVRSFNVSISHLDTLGQLADALHNKDVQGINKIGNYFATQSGSPAPTNFDAAKKVVADEVVKAIVGSGGGVHDREEAARVIAAANSPAQLKGVIKTYQDLMVGQLGGLEQQYRTTTNRDDFNKYLSPQAQSMFHPTGQAPAGGAKPAAQKEFAMLPPAAQYDGRRMQAGNGTTYRSVGGKWVKE